MQPADLSIALRRRTPWEACDLGLSMLQRWARQVYGAHLAVGGALAAAAFALSAWTGVAWLGAALVWWLKPLYDRVVLHVLSRAVFGELQQPREVLRRRREWLGADLLLALTFGRFDLARSFHLPVRQLEGLSGAAGRRRRGVLARRARSNAVWLLVVCAHLEFVVLWSLQSLSFLLVPAKANEGLPPWEILLRSSGGDAAWSLRDTAAYMIAVLLLEPFYVAGGFGLYLNRRTQLEGWDIEVALRRLAEKRAAVATALKSAAGTAAVVLLVSLFACFPERASAQAARDPKAVMAEVKKAPEFGHWQETTSWKRRSPQKDEEQDPTKFLAFGHAFGQAMQVLAWILAIGGVAWLLWWLARLVPPGLLSAKGEAYRPPAALFGMELAPETLPPDVGAAAAALAREGRLRDALSLLYRGVLSDLVHRHNVELLASHTEGEALALARASLGAHAAGYLGTLVGAWAACAYAGRAPQAAQVERLALEYRAALA
jgi:hypothetical protein